MLMFTKVTDATAVAKDGKVSAQFDLVADAGAAQEFVTRNVNGNGAYFIAVIPALEVNQLAPFETKNGKRKFSLDGTVSPLLIEMGDGAVIKVAPTYNTFRLNHEIVKPAA